METTELKRKTFRAVLWTIVRVGLSNLVGFMVFTVLARTLSPSDFGVFALAILVVDLARIVSNAGLSEAIMRDKHHDELLADTAFWANLALSCLAGAVIWVLGRPYARLVGQPEIAAVVHWLALLVPFAALSSIHTARKLGVFGHKAFAARMVFCSAFAGVAAIGSDVVGFGVWSLVIQTAVTDVIGVIFAWQTYRWLPRLRFDIGLLRTVGSFSGNMMLTQVLGLLLTRIQDVVIGRYISTAAVGSYRVAWRMIDLISQVTIQPMVGVSFVTLSQVQDDRERFSRAFLRMLELGALFTFPAIAGFGVVSNTLVPLLFGPKWASSADIARILTLMVVPLCMNLFISPALAAIGRSTTIAKGSIVQTLATLVLSLLAAPFGLQWVAAAYVVRAYVMMPYYWALFARDTGIRPLTMIRAITAPCLATIGMVASLLLIEPFVIGAVGQRLSYLVVMVLLGGIIFGLWLLVCAPGYVRANLGVLLPFCPGHRTRLKRAPDAPQGPASKKGEGRAFL